MKQYNRKELLKVLSKVKPAVATKDYVPILTYFLFDGDSVTAYNDLQAIQYRCETGIEGCMPADLLIKALGSIATDTVEFTVQDGSVLLEAGKTKVTLPTLPVADFPETALTTKLLGKFTVTEDMLDGIRKCLLAVGNDINHADQMGITLDPLFSETQAALYTTDNATISRYIFFSDMELPSDMPIILPTIFCQQLLALYGGTLPEVGIYKGALVARFGEEVVLFTKTIVDEEPMNFADVVDRYVGSGRTNMIEIPEDFAQSIERALLVQEKEVQKSTSFSVCDQRLTLFSSAKSSEAEDTMNYAGDDVVFSVEPSLVKRVIGIVDSVAMLRRVLIFSGSDWKYLHLISHIQD